MANQAHTTRPPKFNLSKIMKRAWVLYHECRCELQREYTASGFKLDRFRNCLKSAWVEAKRQARSLSEQLAGLKYAHKLNQMSDNFYVTNGSYAAAMRQIRTLESQIAVEGRVAA